MDYHKDFVVPLFSGDFDEYLDGMAQSIELRKKDLAPRIWDFKRGERVKFSNTVRPKYLIGVEGTINKVNRVKVVVDLDERHERFFKNITTPLSMIEKV